MNAPISVTAADVIARAKSAIGSGFYHLGNGGRVPANKSPLDDHGACDCSGFVAWCLGVDRYQPKAIDGEWVETTAVYTDAIGKQRLFARTEDRQPGHVIVYPDRDGGQGHIGIVSEVTGGKVTQVIHCSHGNYNTLKYAIAETAPDVFLRHGAIVARFTGLVASSPRRAAQSSIT